MQSYIITINYFFYVYGWTLVEAALFIIGIFICLKKFRYARYSIHLALISFFLSACSIIWGDEVLAGKLGELTFLWIVIGSIALFVHDRKHGKV